MIWLFEGYIERSMAFFADLMQGGWTGLALIKHELLYYKTARGKEKMTDKCL